MQQKRNDIYLVKLQVLIAKNSAIGFDQIKVLSQVLNRVHS